MKNSLKKMEFLLAVQGLLLLPFCLLPHASLRASKDGIIMCGLVGKREHATGQENWSRGAH